MTEQTPPDQIEAPDQLGSEASRFNLELQPNTPLDHRINFLTKKVSDIRLRIYVLSSEPAEVTRNTDLME